MLLICGECGRPRPGYQAECGEIRPKGRPECKCGCTEYRQLDPAKFPAAVPIPGAGAAAGNGGEVSWRRDDVSKCGDELLRWLDEIAPCGAESVTLIDELANVAAKALQIGVCPA